MSRPVSDRAAPLEIVVTARMIDAGVMAFACASAGSDPAEEAREVVERVFLAMLKASGPSQSEE